MRLVFLLIGAFLITACAAYRMDIQQGNVLAPQQVAQVKPGMTKRQVTFALGTPAIADPFREDRWDYVYSQKSGRAAKVMPATHLTVWFEGDVVTRVENSYPVDP